MIRVKVDQIVIPDIRASSKLTPEQEAFFKATVEKFGVIQPILLRKIDGGKYELVAGKTRLDELKARGATEIDAIVIDANEKDSLMMHLAENLARGTIDPIATAKVLKKALESGSTVEEMAKITGHTPEWVRFYLTLLDLPEEYQKCLEDGRLTVSHVRNAAKLNNPIEIDAALSTAVRLGWSAAVLGNYVETRLAQLESLGRKEGTLEPPAPPSENEAERMALYTSCTTCKGMVLRKDLRMPPICEKCLELLNYILSYENDPKKCMELFYEAVTQLERMKRWLQEKATFRPPVPTEPQSGP